MVVYSKKGKQIRIPHFGEIETGKNAFENDIVTFVSMGQFNKDINISEVGDSYNYEFEIAGGFIVGVDLSILIQNKVTYVRRQMYKKIEGARTNITASQTYLDVPSFNSSILAMSFRAVDTKQSGQIREGVYIKFEWTNVLEGQYILEQPTMERIAGSTWEGFYHTIHEPDLPELTNLSVDWCNPLWPKYMTSSASWLQAYTDVDDFTHGGEALEEPDPYKPGGEEEGGGGGGDFKDPSDPTPVPALPSVSVADSGMVTIFQPTITQLRSLADFLWNGDWLDRFQKLFGDPMDAIIGLQLLPVGSENVTLSEIKVGFINTGVSANKVTTQFIEVDCGNISINKFYDSALDYDPLSKISICLPYIGIENLDINEFVKNGDIGLIYHFDLLSGACAAFITSNGNVKYTFTGQCSLNIPLAGRDFGNIIGSTLQGIGGVAQVAAGNAVSGSASIANGLLGMAKQNIKRSGTYSGSASFMGMERPFIVIERAKQSLASNYNKYNGYPSNINMSLSSCSGFTKVKHIHLEGIPASDEELAEIETLLKGGVIL